MHVFQELSVLIARHLYQLLFLRFQIIRTKYQNANQFNQFIINVRGCTFRGIYVPFIYSHARRELEIGRFKFLLLGSCDVSSADWLPLLILIINMLLFS